MHHGWLGCVGAVLLLVAMPAYAEPVIKPMRDTDVVARVNGTPIYRKSVREVVQGVLALQDSEPDPAAVGKLAADALDSLVGLELLYQESQARGIVVTDAAVDAEIAHSKERFPAGAFDQAMKEKGMSQSDLRRETRRTLAVNQLLERTVWKDLSPTAEQIKSFYDQNREEFKHPAEIHASHILIRVPEHATAVQRTAAKQAAEALLAQLRGGADFAQLARAHSQDPVSAAQGGDLGFLSQGEMDATFEKQAFALAPGEMSGVVSTPYGFQIIKVTGRRPAGYQPLEEVQERIKAVLVKSERLQRQGDLVAQLRKKAKIEYTDAATH